MKRLFFITPSLDDIEKAEADLTQQGVAEGHLHTLSNDDAEATKRDLHPLNSLGRKDTVHWMERGSILGAVLAIAVLVGAYFSDLTAAYTWAPFVLLALFLFGFSIWEAGLLGAHKTNSDFAQFDRDIDNGQHVLLVDIDDDIPEGTIKKTCEKYKTLRFAGSGRRSFI